MFTSLFLCIASLFSCVTLTLAWFAFNNNVSGGGIGVGAKKKADLIAYEYYVADTSEANKDKFLFVKTTDETKQKPGAYDVLNRKYQLMIKLYLRADAQKVLVSAETDTKYFLGARASAGGGAARGRNAEKSAFQRGGDARRGGRRRTCGRHE